MLILGIIIGVIFALPVGILVGWRSASRHWGGSCRCWHERKAALKSLEQEHLFLNQLANATLQEEKD